MSEPERRSPVAVSTATLMLGGHAVSVRELPFMGHLLLRFKGGGAAPEPAAIARVETALGCRLPRPGDVFESDSVTTLRLSNRRWLFITDRDANAHWMAQLGRDLPADAALFDLTEAYATLVIEGACARDLLAAGCPIDLHDRTFPVGAATSTRLAQSSIVLRRTDALQYAVHVDASEAGYLWAWLQASVEEFEAEE